MLCQQAPKNFKVHDFKIDFLVSAPCSDVYTWLMKKKTFSGGQIPPYKVEFLQKNESDEMQLGDLTNHHGPFIQFAGAITEIKPGHYRKLDYFYGSYALSFRLARPACLEITTEASDSRRTRIEIKLKTYVYPYFFPVWNLMMNLFWYQLMINFKIIWFFKKR